MSKWIDASLLDIPSDMNDYDELIDFADAVASMIVDAPSISIVLCEECKHWTQAPHTDSGWCDKLDGLLDPTWWCADGERRD